MTRAFHTVTQQVDLSYVSLLVYLTDVDTVTLTLIDMGVSGVFLDSTTDFTVDASSVQPKGEGLVRALITSPSGTLTEAIVKNQQNGLYHCLYTPVEQGLTILISCSLHSSLLSVCFPVH